MNRQELTYFLAGCCKMKSKGPILWLKMKKKGLTEEVLSTIINLGRIANKNKMHKNITSNSLVIFLLNRGFKNEKIQT